jgi:REP element-mobilizing transposase RayT
LLAGFHARGALPHLKKLGASYFVTFREAGSLPGDILARFRAERIAILEKALAAKRPLTWREQLELRQWFSERVDKLLDAGHGSCRLADPRSAEVISKALLHFDGSRYHLHAWVVMPNHVHVVVQPVDSHSLSEILHSWKSYTSHAIRRMHPAQGGALWQKESYDHLIRDDEELWVCREYTVLNPVAARLCSTPEEYRWSSRFAANPG